MVESETRGRPDRVEKGVYGCAKLGWLWIGRKMNEMKRDGNM